VAWITRAQFEQIEDFLPTQRGNVSLSSLQVLNAILYVAEHGCKWRGLPKRFGNWHTIYTRMNRWAKSGVLDRAFAQLQLAQVVQIKIEAVSLDSTSVKVHPDDTGARKKKRSASYRQVPRRMEYQDPPSRRRRAHGRYVLVVARPGTRCTRRSRVTQALGRAEPAAASAHGSGL
jgi:transposase